jgi:hypothetical protein
MSRSCCVNIFQRLLTSSRHRHLVCDGVITAGLRGKMSEWLFFLHAFTQKIAVLSIR